MTTPTLTNREKLALRGKLTRDEFHDIGMDLFVKGLVGLDPLATREVTYGGTSLYNGVIMFPLTERGSRIAIALRNPTTKGV